MDKRSNARSFLYPENIIADLYETRLDIENAKKAIYENEQAVKERLEKTISIFPERERCITRYRYEKQMTIREIGEKLNISGSRVNQIIHKALRKLRQPKKANYIIFGAESYEEKPSIESGVHVLGLSVRAYNCLRQANIDTVKQVIALSDDDFMRIRNLGRKTIEEIKEKTKEFLGGLSAEK